MQIKTQDGVQNVAGSGTTALGIIGTVLGGAAVANGGLLGNLLGGGSNQNNALMSELAKEKGIKVGVFRPITLWPFPKKVLNEAADKVNKFISVELSMGQMIEDIRLATECKKPVTLCNRAGGIIPSPEEVLAAIVKANENGGDL